MTEHKVGPQTPRIGTMLLNALVGPFDCDMVLPTQPMVAQKQGCLHEVFGFAA